MFDAKALEVTVTVIVVPALLPANAVDGATFIVTSAKPQFFDGSTVTVSKDTRVTVIVALLVSPRAITIAIERLSTSTR